MGKSVGSLEQLLMFAVVRLKERAHGLALRRELEQVTGRKVSPGAIYTTLSRLEDRGLVTSALSDETPAGGGRRRKFYALSPLGAQTLHRSYEEVMHLADDVLADIVRLASK